MKTKERTATQYRNPSSGSHLSPPASEEGDSTRTSSLESRTKIESEQRAIRVDDSTCLSAQIRFDPSQTCRGTVVFVHGFCGDKRENGLFDSISDRCARDGFLTLAYDWRGLGESDGDFPSARMEDHMGDFVSLIHWVKENYPDQSRSTFALGFSLGAAVIGLAIRELREAIHGISYLSPAVRPKVSMWPRYDRAEHWASIRSKGFFPKGEKQVPIGETIMGYLRDTDLGLNAFHLPVPLLICHGEEDSKIDIRHTKEIYQTCRSSRGDLEFRAIPRASHSFRPENEYWPQISSLVSQWFLDRAKHA